MARRGCREGPAPLLLFEDCGVVGTFFFLDNCGNPFCFDKYDTGGLRVDELWSEDEALPPDRDVDKGGAGFKPDSLSPEDPRCNTLSMLLFGVGGTTTSSPARVGELESCKLCWRVLVLVFGATFSEREVGGSNDEMEK